ncbi:hypothetical protein GHT06_017816 [Daphnia sinensis]|uniref:MICOS complex subunit MIC19 n=1 Tax=Daphnia sinensis TaxID=1820382 RepID=A0AAD5PPK9_9CRUS|nr:hypothetical protein GHT06_017816 [Daphnia sinensis]
MGNSPSNRKITVVNDEVAGVIKISDSVVRRLKGEIEREREAKSSHQPVQTKQQNEDSDLLKASTNETLPRPREMQVPNKAATSPSSGNKQNKEPNPYGHFMEEAHLTSLKIRQEKEAEIQRVQEHWRNQLLNLTEHYSKLAEQTEAEYRAAIEDIQRSFSKESFKDVCGEQKGCVLKCYKENKDKPLFCANEVKEFASCVDKFRADKLAR